MKIEIEVSEKQLDALAQVLKRVGFTDIRKLSGSEEEAYDAQYALEQIRQSLAESGYNPR